MNTITIRVSLMPTSDKVRQLYLKHRRTCDALLPTLLALAHYQATYSLQAYGVRVCINCSSPFAIRDYILRATPLTSPSVVTCTPLYRFLLAPCYRTLANLVSHVVLTLSIY